jgi:predicted Zn-dependent protease
MLIEHKKEPKIPETLERPRSRRSRAVAVKLEKQRGKRVLNVRLLVLTLLLVATIGGLGTWWYLRSSRQLATALLARATALEQNKQWTEAVSYLRRYLQFKPDDLDVRVRIIEAVERSSATLAQRRNLIRLLSETTGLLPHRTDLRIKLAQNMFDIGWFSQAADEAQKLLSKHQTLPVALTAEQFAALSRIKAISLAYQTRRGGLVSVATAANSLREALKANPRDSQVAFLLADLYRTNPQDAGVDEAAVEADRIMDQLIAADPDNSQALLARYQYRRRYGIADARHDLDYLLEKKPDDVEALLLAAREDFSSREPHSNASAKEKLLKAISLAPKDARGPITLAELYAFNGEREQAVDMLTSSRKQLDAPNLELEGLLAGLLLDLNRIEEAERVMAGIDRVFHERLPEMSTQARRKQDNINRLLKARLYLAQNDLGRSIGELRGVIATAQQSADMAGASIESMQAYSMLATIMTRFQRIDLAAEYWKSVADQSMVLLNTPSMRDQAGAFQDASWRAATAFMALGRPGEAIKQLEDYLQLPTASPDARVTLVESHLQQQLRMPADQRNWSEFLAVLEQAKSQLPNRWELSHLEALYHEAQGTADSKRRAVELLRNIEAKVPSAREFWRRQVLMFLQCDAGADTTRALGRYEQLDESVTRRALLRAHVFARTDRVNDALIELSNVIPKANPEEQLDLQFARFKLLLSTNHLEEANRLIAELIEQKPNEPRLIGIALEAAFSQRDLPKVRQLEDALRSQSTVDDYDWQCVRASRLIEEYAKLDASERTELKRLIETLRATRPSWYPIIALAGRHAELEGNRNLAIEAYRSAVELGDTRPATFERLVTSLYAEGRYRDADTYLSRLTSEAPGYDRLESIAIAAAVKGNRIDEALERAKDAIARGSNDPMHYVWHASLLLLGGNAEAAEKAFRDAVLRFPDDSRVWSGLFTCLVRTRKTNEARQVLKEWSEKIAADKFYQNLVLAQGYEMLGDIASSKKEYQDAISIDSRSTSARLRLARLLLAAEPAAAREQYEEILKTDPSNAEARRNLAAALAASGDNDDWMRAIQLLETDSDSGTNITSTGYDDRLRAILMARRGRNRVERLQNFAVAKQILTTRISGNNEEQLDIDRMLLAGIHEQEALLRRDPALLQSAREALRPLVDRANPPANYLALYIEFLLRNLKPESLADKAVISDEQRDVFINDARLRIDELQAALADNQAADVQFPVVIYRARLLMIEKQDRQLQQLLDDFAKTQQQRLKDNAGSAKFYLQMGNLNSMIGKHAQAESWYRRLTKLAPSGYILLARSLLQQNRIDEAIEIALSSAARSPTAESAAVLAQLMSAAEGASKLSQRVEPVIASALKAHGENIELLTSVAVEKVTKGDQTEAIRIFRKVLEIDPHHTLTLNNLATLLADRPNQLKEAREYIERATAIAGRNPALLVTLGTVLIRAGEHEEAVDVLEEAVAGVYSDPRAYFQLAIAYQKSGNDTKARSALETSRQQGLDRAILTVGDKELLKSLEKELLTSNSTTKK